MPCLPQPSSRIYDHDDINRQRENGLKRNSSAMQQRAFVSKPKNRAVEIAPRREKEQKAKRRCE